MHGGREDKSLPITRKDSCCGVASGNVSSVEGSSQLRASVSSMRACKLKGTVAIIESLEPEKEENKGWWILLRREKVTCFN